MVESCPNCGLASGLLQLRIIICQMGVWFCPWHINVIIYHLNRNRYDSVDDALQHLVTALRKYHEAYGVPPAIRDRYTKGKVKGLIERLAKEVKKDPDYFVRYGPLHCGYEIKKYAKGGTALACQDCCG